IATVCEDQERNIWIGTFDKGLSRRGGGGQMEHFNLPTGVNRNAFFSACPDNRGRLWLSADREDLYTFETNVFSKVGSVHGVKAIFADKENRVWLGRQTLSCWTNGTILNFDARNGFEGRE